MDQHIGLDVSLKDTSISIRQDGKRVWRGKCVSDPKLLAEVIRKRAPHAKRVVFETGPLSVWFYHALIAEGLPAICIDARHAKAALDMAANKTDANDADGLAQLAAVLLEQNDEYQLQHRYMQIEGMAALVTPTIEEVQPIQITPKAA